MRKAGAWLAVVSSALLLLAAAAPVQRPLQIDNLMPAFWNVLDTTLGKPTSVRVAAFKEQVILPGLPVYADGEFRRDLSSDDRIAAYLDGLAPIVPQMREVSRRLGQQIPLVAQNVEAALPDLSTDRIVVYILPSFHHFNGQTHDIGEKIGVLFGVDGIVQYGSQSSDIGVDVSHELFHIYQFEMHPGYRTDQASLWQAVWGEGSAAYASQVLTPNATESAALGNELAVAGTDATKELACGILAKWNSHDGGDMAAYVDAGSHPPSLPARGGYLIGYLVARDLAKTRSLSQIGKLDGDDLERHMRDGVGALCKSGVI